MIIVSDTSPINNLAAIDQLQLLKRLYGTVSIPEAVYSELTDPDFPIAGAAEVQQFDWIQVRQVSNRALVESLKNELEGGEAEAIALALEMDMAQVLIDERQGRLVAARLNLKYTEILGILLEAKHQNLIATVRPQLGALIEKAGFWVAEPLYRKVLQRATSPALGLAHWPDQYEFVQWQPFSDTAASAGVFPASSSPYSLSPLSTARFPFGVWDG